MFVKYLRNGTDGVSTAYDAGDVADVDPKWAGRVLETQDKSNPMIAEATQAEFDEAKAAKEKAAADAAKAAKAAK